MFLLPILLSGCDFEKLGAYTCDEYCEQVLTKTEECAEIAATDACEDAGGTECGGLTDEQLGDYAATARSDWKDKSRVEMVASCNADIEAAEKTDAACQAETATINNLTCDQILGTLTTIAAAAQ